MQLPPRRYICSAVRFSDLLLLLKLDWPSPSSLDNLVRGIKLATPSLRNLSIRALWGNFFNVPVFLGEHDPTGGLIVVHAMVS